MHWVFAVKYWSLSIKLQQISKEKDADAYNTLFYILLFIGLILNCASGILFGYEIYFHSPHDKTTVILNCLTQVPLLISSIMLFDAFRRLAKLDEFDIILSFKQIVMHSIAFGFYSIAILVFIVQ